MQFHLLVYYSFPLSTQITYSQHHLSPCLYPYPHVNINFSLSISRPPSTMVSHAELNEFQLSTRELEDEYELQLQDLETKNKDMINDNFRINTELKQLQVCRVLLACYTCWLCRSMRHIVLVYTAPTLLHKTVHRCSLYYTTSTHPTLHHVLLNTATVHYIHYYSILQHISPYIQHWYTMIINTATRYYIQVIVKYRVM